MMRFLFTRGRNNLPLMLCHARLQIIPLYVFVCVCARAHVSPHFALPRGWVQTVCKARCVRSCAHTKKTHAFLSRSLARERVWCHDWGRVHPLLITMRCRFSPAGGNRLKGHFKRFTSGFVLSRCLIWPNLWFYFYVWSLLVSAVGTGTGCGDGPAQ